MDEIWLRERAREIIRAGQLPDHPTHRTWGGPGSGQPCIICGRPLAREESELEVEFFPSGETDAPVARHLHVLCFNAWQLECRSGLAGAPEDLSPEGNDGTMQRDERDPPHSRG